MKKLLTVAFLIIVSVLTISILGYNGAFATSKKFDGTHGYISIWFDHGFISQYQPIKELTDMGIPCGILVLYNKDNTTGYMTWDQIKEQQKKGCEIIEHSFNHVAINKQTPYTVVLAEVVGAKYAMVYGQGFKPITYAAPNDAMTLNSTALVNAEYTLSVIGNCKENTLATIANDGKIRGLTIPSIHHCGVDVMNGTGDQVAPIGNFTKAKYYIDYAVTHHTWLGINFHQIDELISPYHTSHDEWEMIRGYIVKQIQAGNLTAVTPCQGAGTC